MCGCDSFVSFTYYYYFFFRVFIVDTIFCIFFFFFRLMHLIVSILSCITCHEISDVSHINIQLNSTHIVRLCFDHLICIMNMCHFHESNIRCIGMYCVYCICIVMYIKSSIGTIIRISSKRKRIWFCTNQDYSRISQSPFNSIEYFSLGGLNLI